MADMVKRLSGPTALTTSAVTQYTVPVGTTATVRSIHAANVSGGYAALTVSLGADGAATRLFAGTSIPTTGVLDWSGMIVLTAGETIQAKSDVGAALVLVVSGVEST